MKQLFIPLFLLAVWPVSQALAARTWTDNQGKTQQGDFVRVFNGDVVIQRPNKAILKVPYWNLSEADRDYVKEQLEAKGQTSLIPPEPARNTNPGSGVPGLPGGLGPVPGPGTAPGFPGPGFPGAGAPGAPSIPPLPGPGLPGPGFPGPGFPSTPGGAPSAPGTVPPTGGYPGLPSPPGTTTPPTEGYSGAPSFPGAGSTITPPRFEMPSIKYKLSCPKCSHSWQSDTPDVFARCPSCGHDPHNMTPSTTTPSGNMFPSSPPPMPSAPPTIPSYSSPPSGAPNDSQMAARQAEAITAVVLMIACPLVIGLVFILAIVAIIFFVVKAVSSPAPVATVRRNY